ncbi:MAG: MFS transporter [Phenylobacterium sp.]|uniref:MFS transporter n=1 Tax=Phenylobacterium sp. TaxID=1871053 RepID=UPI0027356ECD|nr:MFS transporter [Phenylobacterium sp.]MDP3172908.1 MFS transporter [Phenylobacterium sp.]
MDPKIEVSAAGPEADLQTREAAYGAFVRDNLKHNYRATYLHGMLGMTGFRLVQAPTFLPAYLHALSGSSSIVGLALALQQMGGVISPIFGATLIEHRTKVLPATMLMGTLSRLVILGMALAGWLLSGQSLVIALLALMFLFGLLQGPQRVQFAILLSKVIPIAMRGRLQAWRNATGGLIAAVLAYLAGRYLIEANVMGNGYSTTFLAAFVLTSAGLLALRTMREPEPPTTRERGRFRDRLRDFPRLVTQDRSYMWFLVVQMMSMTSRIAVPFYVIYVGQSIPMTGATLGLLSLAFLGADTLSNLVWGYWGDKTGFRMVLLMSLAIWAGATMLLMGVHHLGFIFIAFFGLGAAQSGYQMAAQTMILEFGSRDELPMRIAISSTAENVMATIGPLMGGVLAEFVGFQMVFGLSLVALAAAVVLTVVAVPEPRKRRV